MLCLQTVTVTVLKFEVNIGHYIAAFGGGGGCFNSSQVLKEHVAVAYPNKITLFKNDTGAVAFTLSPFQAQQAILFASRSSQNAWIFTVSGDYMYACQGSITNKYHINQKKHILCFEGHTDSIISLVVSGSFLFTSSWDNTIKKWDVTSGANLTTISGHLKSIAFNCLIILYILAQVIA
jgi:WD40 repeat protein